jgi:MFS family permease
VGEGAGVRRAGQVQSGDERVTPGYRGGWLRRVPGIGTDFGLGRNNQLLFWAMLFNEASFGFYQTLYPLYVESLGASPGVVGLVIGMSGLARLLFLVPSGALADRMALRRLIIGGRSLTVAGTLLVGLAQHWWQLLPMLLLLSAGNIAFPAISKVIADSTTEHTRTRAFTLIYTVGPSAALLLSPSLGGVLADTIALRSIFFAAAAAQAVAVFFFTRLNYPPQHETARPNTSYRAALTYRPVLLLCTMQMALLLIFTTGYTLVPNYLEDQKHLSIGTIGQFGSLVAVCSIVLGVVIARIKPFSRPLNALLLCCLLTPISFLLLLFGNATWLFALGYFFRGGYYVAWGVFYSALGEVTPRHLRSRTFALGEILGGAGFGLAPFAAGVLYEIDPALPLYSAIVLTAPLVVGILIVRRVLVHARANVPAENAAA